MSKRRSSPPLEAGSLVTITGGKNYRTIPRSVMARPGDTYPLTVKPTTQVIGLVVQRIDWQRGYYEIAAELQPGAPLVTLEVNRADIIER
ncbi:hypothetical protein K2Q16_01970 [Patescibacteria group bacterium]|nr:hypothetical protein [Patescibacteria group bacterium]